MRAIPTSEASYGRLTEAADRFARRMLRVRPPSPSDEDARREARVLLALLGEAGWCRYTVPAEGGGELPAVSVAALCSIREALAAASPLADAVFALQALGAMPIVLSANRELQARWLPEVAAGRAMAAFAMTEPEAGSDVGAIATRAERRDGGWRLDGRKHLISNAGIADFYAVFAQTDPAAGRRGIACFVVPADASGLAFAGAQVLSEPHPLGAIELNGCRIPDSALLAGPGEGFALGLRALDLLRPTVAAAACGFASRALEEAVAHATTRRQFGKMLAEQQLIQAKLARMATDLEAARLLTRRAAEAADSGAASLTLAAAQAKLFATEAAQRIVDEAVQILGGRGVLAASPVDRLYRAVRALRIYEGTSEIQQLVIARELLRNSVAPAVGPGPGGESRQE